MATLTGQAIKDTYDGLLKTTDSTTGLPATGQVRIQDGVGNNSALQMGRQGNGVYVSGQLRVEDLGNQLSIESQGDKLLEVNNYVTKLGDIDGASDEGHLVVDGDNSEVTFRQGQSDRIALNASSEVIQYGQGTNNASGCGYLMRKGQSNEVEGNINLNYATFPNSNLELQYTDPGNSNTIKVYGGYTYYSKPIRIGGNGSQYEFDAYEEGTWTPTINGFMGGFSGLSYTTQTGTYTRIGDTVRLNYSLVFTATITAGYIVYIAGLPFAPSSTQSYGISANIGYKNNFDFTYSTPGAISEFLVGSQKFIGSEFTLVMNAGNTINDFKTTGLVGSSSNAMQIRGTFLYKI